MNDEIHQERRRIAYRLIGRLAADEISHATKLSIEEVQELQEKRITDYEYRRKINPLYNGDMELDESDATVRLKSIWTRHHEEGAIKYLKETIQLTNESINETTDENEKKKLEKFRDKMQKELEEREENLYG